MADKPHPLPRKLCGIVALQPGTRGAGRPATPDPAPLLKPFPTAVFVGKREQCGPSGMHGRPPSNGDPYPESISLRRLQTTDRLHRSRAPILQRSITRLRHCDRWAGRRFWSNPPEGGAAKYNLAPTPILLRSELIVRESSVGQKDTGTAKTIPETV